jgi:hypothetical protein
MNGARVILEARPRRNQASRMRVSAPRTTVADRGLSSRYGIRSDGVLSLRHQIATINAEKGLTRKSAP